MINIVIDTNIIVSAALSPNGKPSQIISLITDNADIQIYYCTAILNEYSEVLARPRLKISPQTQVGIINAIKEDGILVDPIISSIILPDESDRVFYDTAKTVGAFLITGNIKHFPKESFIMTPSDFINEIKRLK